ncbi:ATPase, T2SS/T4P/T4SS family [Campylobacter upsaliensis]|uniref:ATPase, T2SS/T4P/T4SS family n=1 Tax=Campylobacter upsaliensis TaxID=28080 RepID=UPI00214A5428|nr:ATPase, T2SS/T4P/T4SS family [Campylobacter upsaliensis]MCR2104880.1 ATPase, T2SS/T4P/T4SS family [Campylobacter upsaliensis]MCR2110919.1 ATPase, T2SS/T4P/T4SS family [Campylobacter upsaliensis]
MNELENLQNASSFEELVKERNTDDNVNSLILDNCLEVLDPYLNLQANEICFNEPKRFFVDKGGIWEEKYDERLDYDFLESFLIELATRRNQQFDEKHCHLSCELPPPYFRYRVQAQHKSSLFNSSISICIRIPSKEKFKLEDFVLSTKCLNQGWTYDKLKELIHNKRNVLISGGTGTGKTSFFNSLLKELHSDERCISIEDSQELDLSHIRNKTQLSVPKTASEIYSYQDAINNAMRLRPDRLFLGEIDIRNTFAFLRVNNTGHAGNLSTLHANDPKSAIKAIKANIILGGGLQNPDNNMLIEQIITAIDTIIQIKRERGARIITDTLNLKEELTQNQGYFL